MRREKVEGFREGGNLAVFIVAEAISRRRLGHTKGNFWAGDGHRWHG